LPEASIELVAWAVQAAIANNDAARLLTDMLTMTRTKTGPEFPGDYSSANTSVCMAREYIQSERKSNGAKGRNQ
jgi:hypothetical protein